MPKILLVEDDHDLASMVRQNLLRENAQVEMVHSGSEAMDVLTVSSFDLIVLDWDLPGASGVQVCKWHREKGGQTPILMLTGKDTVADKEMGLDSGADDYLTKPFSLRELTARIRALLRRSSTIVSSNVLTRGPYTLDPTKFRLEKNGQLMSLQPREFALVEFLMRHPDEVFSDDALLERVWETDSEATSDALRACIKRVRKKLDDPGIIENVHGVGYRLGAKAH